MSLPPSLYDNACIKEETMYYVYDLEIISSIVLLSILNISDEKINESDRYKQKSTSIVIFNIIIVK